MPRLLPVVLLASAVLAGAASAQTNVSIQEMLSACAGVVPGFERADVNGDGFVTATEHATHDVTVEVIEPSTAEIQAELRAVWTAMNSDGDAVVTLEEYSAAGRLRYDQAAEAALLAEGAHS